jgi:competence protein ComFA
MVLEKTNQSWYSAPRLAHWIEKHIQQKRPAFIFVPTIDTALRLVPLLKKFHSSIEAVHSEDPERHDKVSAFRKGEIPILVTTTILERGVTIPFLDIAVLGADEPIFDERALVQISGRVGRDHREPGGDIVFFHQGLTLGMLGALRHIRQMNREGRKM